MARRYPTPRHTRFRNDLRDARSRRALILSFAGATTETGDRVRADFRRTVLATQWAGSRQGGERYHGVEEALRVMHPGTRSRGFNYRDPNILNVGSRPRGIGVSPRGIGNGVLTFGPGYARRLRENFGVLGGAAILGGSIVYLGVEFAAESWLGANVAVLLGIRDDPYDPSRRRPISQGEYWQRVNETYFC